ncbi:DUF4157 domain-containing protein [Paenibacillus flagellatus]|uniref:Flagellar motor protein MotB n=1 Tax=Paenibacillus flagellatus TaxID=2211139 RepID=A0A2V5KTP7_9BACL|nr:DUF4157 domain-containing protein [Paenibacillus flagellatus]PYI55167.1 flagellar motor protein MotB [Paenibacillus flagellatus]
MSTRHTSMQRKPDGEWSAGAKRAAKPARSASAHPMMQLQRTVGNRALGDMLSGAGPGALPAGVQTKLTVGPAGDSFEQEADQVGRLVADRISSAPDGGSSVQREADEEELQLKRAPEGIQRMGGPEDEEELQLKRAPEGVQRSAIEEEELQLKRAPEAIQRMGGPEDEEELQLKRSGEGFDADVSLERQIEQSRGGGAPMDTRIQAKMESAFGTGFGDVNIHTGPQADDMAQSIGASAFTTGSDIFFRQGQYNPDSRQGQELLGHELTHVVQQRGGTVPTEQR